jgi:hypothetical protein
MQPFLPGRLGVISDSGLDDVSEGGDPEGPQSAPRDQPTKALQGLVDPTEIALKPDKRMTGTQSVFMKQLTKGKTQV